MLNFCIEIDNLHNSDLLIDSKEIKDFLDKQFQLCQMDDKQIKRKMIEIFNNESIISSILDQLDISYKYFIELLIINYSTIFTSFFINKYIKNKYNIYNTL